MKYFYTIEQIAAIRRQVEAYGLEVPDGFYGIGLRKLQKFFNGCGAEYFPRIVRSGLSAYTDRYAPDFMVHDVDYEIGTDKAVADRRMLKNMWRVFRHHFGFWWFVNKSALFELFLIIVPSYIAVRLGGNKAYDDSRKVGEK